jgi:hypothetical protein
VLVEAITTSATPAAGPSSGWLGAVGVAGCGAGAPTSAIPPVAGGSVRRHSHAAAPQSTRPRTSAGSPRSSNGPAPQPTHTVNRRAPSRPAPQPPIRTAAPPAPQPPQHRPRRYAAPASTAPGRAAATQPDAATRLGAVIRPRHGMGGDRGLVWPVPPARARKHRHSAGRRPHTHTGPGTTGWLGCGEGPEAPGAGLGRVAEVGTPVLDGPLVELATWSPTAQSCRAGADWGGSGERPEGTPGGRGMGRVAEAPRPPGGRGRGGGADLGRGVGGVGAEAPGRRGCGRMR